MWFKKSFPYALVACFALGISWPATAQTLARRSVEAGAVANNYDDDEFTEPEDDPVIVPKLAEDLRPARSLKPVGINFLKFETLISAAIDDRLGARYRYGGTGPSGFDCSGFVWSTFRSAGIDFERGSARHLWNRFEPAASAEQFKFGTLVFFSGLAHVGIVVDEHGFYHASRRHGVIYSSFSDYWLSRIDGFRRVPLPATLGGD